MPAPARRLPDVRVRPYADLPVQESFPGVRTFRRVRQCRHDATRLTLKWSRAELLTMILSAVHAGQVYRITYPVRVPLTSGYWVFAIIVLNNDVFMVPG